MYQRHTRPHGVTVYTKLKTKTSSMTTFCHCVISIHSSSIGSIRGSLRARESKIFDSYQIRSFSTKNNHMIIGFNTSSDVDIDDIMRFLNKSEFGVYAATLWFEISPYFGKIVYTMENGIIDVLSKTENRCPEGLSKTEEHIWLIANHYEEYLPVWGE